MRLGSFTKVTTSPKASFPQLCHWGSLTGNLKPYQGQGLQGSSLVISSNGCHRDYVPRLLALPIPHCISMCISALHAPLGCNPPCATGMLTPTFDQPCQPSSSHHSAPMPLTCPTLLQHSRNSSCQGTTNQNLPLLSKCLVPCSEDVTIWHRVCSSSCLSLGIIALLCSSSHATLGHAQPIFPALHFAHGVLGGSLNACSTPHAHTI